MIKVDLLYCDEFWESIDADPKINTGYSKINAHFIRQGADKITSIAFVDFLKEYYGINAQPGIRYAEVLMTEKDFVWFSLKYDIKADVN